MPGSRICETGGPGIQMPRQAWESRWAGGGLRRTHFFFGRHLHYGVGVPSAYQIDLWGEKQKHKKRPKGGGGGARSRFGPLWIRHCMPGWYGVFQMSPNSIIHDCTFLFGWAITKWMIWNVEKCNVSTLCGWWVLSPDLTWPSENWITPSMSGQLKITLPVKKLDTESCPYSFAATYAENLTLARLGLNFR